MDTKISQSKSGCHEETKQMSRFYLSQSIYETY